MSIKSFIMRALRSYYLQESGKEKISPNDWVQYDQIVYDKELNLLSIKLKPEVKIFGVADTGSMDPVIDAEHTLIATNNFDYHKLAPGDIIIFQYYVQLIVHRIIEVGENERLGWYCRTRGDNCIDREPYYIIPNMIKWLVIGVIY